MAYEMLEQQIKSLPYEYYMQVERFVNFMVHEAEKQAEEKYASAISEKAGILPFDNMHEIDAGLCLILGLN